MGKKNNKDRKKTISCGCLVYRHPTNEWSDTEILLVKQFEHKDNWGIPKGHIDKGETYEQCAVRETREETGIEVVLGGRLPDAYAIYKKEDKTVVTYLAEQLCCNFPSSGHPDSEVAAACWFKIEQLPQIHSYQQDMIRNGLSVIKLQFEAKLCLMIVLKMQYRLYSNMHLKLMYGLS